MKAIFRLFLLLPFLVSPAYSETLKFDTFLVRFRSLYENYHFGSHWPTQKVDKEAMRIWSGAGGDYESASITACQGIFETHYNIDAFVYGHRGHCGMRVSTIIAEGIRQGMIKKGNQEGVDWLLKACRKDPGLADKLAASRLIYLSGLTSNAKRALRIWVRGPLKSQNDKDKKDSEDYSNGVLKLKQIQFGGNE